MDTRRRWKARKVACEAAAARTPTQPLGNPMSADARAKFRSAMSDVFTTRYSNQLGRQQQINMAVLEFLSTSGTSCNTAQGIFWIDDDDGKSWDPTSEEFLAFLASITHSPGGSNEWRSAVLGAAKTACLRPEVPLTRCVQLSAIGDDGVLYVRRNDQTLFRVSGSGVSVVRNGSGGLVIQAGDDFEPVLGDLKPSDEPLKWMREELAKWSVLRDFGSSEGSQLLSHTVASLLLPPEMVGSHPLVTFLDPGGVTSETMARLVLNLVWGKHVEVQPPPDRYGQNGFETLLAGRCIFGISGAHAGADWLAPLLRALARRAVRTRRELFANKKLVSLPLGARVVLAADANPMSTSPGDAAVLMPYWLAESSSTCPPPEAMEEWGEAVREQFYADALELFRRLAVRWGEKRMGRGIRGPTLFDDVLLRMSEGAGCSLVAASAHEVLDRARAELVVNNDQLAEALMEQILPFCGSATGLLDILQVSRVPTKKYTRWDDWSADKVGTRLAEIAPAMALTRGVRIKSAPRTAASRLWTIERM